MKKINQNQPSNKISPLKSFNPSPKSTKQPANVLSKLPVIKV